MPKFALRPCHTGNQLVSISSALTGLPAMGIVLLSSHSMGILSRKRRLMGRVISSDECTLVQKYTSTSLVLPCSTFQFMCVQESTPRRSTMVLFMPVAKLRSTLLTHTLLPRAGLLGRGGQMGRGNCLTGVVVAIFVPLKNKLPAENPASGCPSWAIWFCFYWVSEPKPNIF